jgi:phage terminase small subunit
VSLTPKQQRFVDEYLVDLNALQAAIRAGYSAKTAGAIGHENLNKPEIAAAVQEAMQKRAGKTAVDQEMVVKGLMAEAQATGEDTTSSARIRAWELLGKHVGMFSENHVHTGPGGGPIEHKVTRVEIVPGSAK